MESAQQRFYEQDGSESAAWIAIRPQDDNRSYTVITLFEMKQTI